MKLKLQIFKVSGKYYTDEEVEIPDDVKWWDWVSHIKKNDLLEGHYINMTALGHYPNEVPFLMVIG